MDFNPTIDRVRVVTNSTQNLVYNPNSSAAPTVNTELFYPGGGTALIIDNTYSNNLQGSGLPTVQYGIDYGRDTLVTINNNAGDLTTVGSLGAGVNADDLTGFDIFTSLSGVNTGYAILNGGTTPSLYTINLGTGAATRVGTVGGSGFGESIYSLAVTPVGVAPEPGFLRLPSVPVPIPDCACEGSEQKRAVIRKTKQSTIRDICGWTFSLRALQSSYLFVF